MLCYAGGCCLHTLASGECSQSNTTVNATVITQKSKLFFKKIGVILYNQLAYSLANTVYNKQLPYSLANTVYRVQLQSNNRLEKDQTT